MKKALIFTILGTSILFGCGNSEVKKPEVTETPEVEQSDNKEKDIDGEKEEQNSEIDFKSYADIIKFSTYEDGFISVEELIDTELKLGDLVDESFFKRMLELLNEYNEEHDSIGLTVEQFDEKMKTEK